jgi:hypothetical protein
MAKGFNTLKPRTGIQDSVRLDEVIEMHKLPDNEDVRVRFLPGPILPVKQHWIRIYAGKENKEIKVPRYCVSFDPENEDTPREGVECPYCQLSQGQQGTCQTSTFYLANAIIRELQEDEPAKKVKPTETEKKTKFKDIKSKSWTPVRVLRITNTVASRIQELGSRNTVEKKGKKVAYDITDAKYGRDIILRYKPKGAGTDKYSCDREDRTPLTEDEENYLTWELSNKLLEVTGLQTQKQAEEDLRRTKIVGGEDVGDEEDDDKESLKFSKKNKDKKKGKSKDEDDDYSDDDEDPFEEGKNKKKSKDKKKKRRDDDDEDEEDSKSSKKSKDKNKKKKRDLDDDDSDEDDSSSKKKSKDKKKRRDEDDEEDEDDFGSKKKKKGKNFAFDDEDEDDDDRKSSKKSKNKDKKKRRDDDDEDEDSDRSSKKKNKGKSKSNYDLDDDEDDRKSSKKSKNKDKKKGKKTNKF